MSTTKPKPIPEPKRCDMIAELASYLHQRVRNILNRMRARGFDPQVFESYRSQERQWYLYGKGRSAAQLKRAHVDVKWAQPSAKIVTQTVDSKHRKRKAVDIISKSSGWSNPAFFIALKEEAEREGMHTLANNGDACHVEWDG